jgi:hypothetical protein
MTDAEMTRNIVGKWRDNFRAGNITIVTTDNFKKDGTLERHDLVGGNMNHYSKLTWSIKNGSLIMVVVEGPVAKGTVLRGKIISMDEDNYRIEMEAGADIKKTRVKE